VAWLIGYMHIELWCSCGRHRFESSLQRMPIL